MARIEDDRWIIETEEEAESISKLLNESPKVNEKLQSALNEYKGLVFGESFDRFDLFEQDLKQPETEIKYSGNEVTVENIKNSFSDLQKFESIFTPYISDLSSLRKDMIEKPWKYATHCLKADPKSIFIYKEGEFQLLFIEGKWQDSNVFKGLLQPIEIEYHDWLDPVHKYDNYAYRKDVNEYYTLLMMSGIKALDDLHTELGNTNSLSVIPKLNAIQIVKFNHGYL